MSKIIPINFKNTLIAECDIYCRLTKRFCFLLGSFSGAHGVVIAVGSRPIGWRSENACCLQLTGPALKEVATALSRGVFGLKLNATDAVFGLSGCQLFLYTFH